MIKRTCPKCGKGWYSADTTDETWACGTCGAEIPKSQQEGISEKDGLEKAQES